MRVLFLTPPALASHLYVQVPLIHATRAAGHEVVVAVHPDLVPTATSAGLTTVPVGHDMLETLGRVDADEPPHTTRPPGAPAPRQQDYAAQDPRRELEYLSDCFLRHLCTEDLVDDLVSFGQAWGVDLVVWDQLCYAGGIAATALGVPHVRMLFGTDGIAQLATAVDPHHDVLGTWVRPALARTGTDWDPRAVTADLTIDTMPPWVWRPDGPAYARMRHVAYNGPGTVPRWAVERPERPRVAITLGLSHATSDVEHASVADLLDAVADLDAEVVATVGGDVPPGFTVPDNVRVVTFVPVNALFPTCAAVVHHGGSGTFAAAYEHGVPQLVVPSVYWSDRWFGPVAQVRGLEDEGAGLHVADSDALDPDRLRTCLDTVLGDGSYATAARRLRRRYEAVPGPADVVPVLEGLLR